VLRDGWLRTGDIARVDGDGRYYIDDRLRDVINRGGEKVFSLEVEAVLSAHVDVAEAAVVGVPDEMMGHKVGAVLVPRGQREMNPQSVARSVATQLADYKVPQFVWARSEPLPRNAGGKVDKGSARLGRAMVARHEVIISPPGEGR
jgi:acyl-CoA synthetase (AMP-forming)/AMP-acid ligase II